MGVRDLVEEFAPDAVALEESFVGADARTASLSARRGRRARRLRARRHQCTDYAPSRMKQAVCGYGRAERDRSNAWCEILALRAPLKTTHESDALAVAICHALAPPLLKAVGS